jgi:tRNA nucleotidyltransferase (CCA-adding enzyme)
VVDIILTHEHADFDAIAAILAAYKLNPGALPVLPERINRNVERFLALYQKGLPFARQTDVRRHAVKKIVLVDSQRPVHIKSVASDVPLSIIDHHPLAVELRPEDQFVSEDVGAVTTLLVEQIQQHGLTLTSLEATLLVLGIYEDTGSLTYATTTPRDLVAAAWLIQQGAVMDEVRRFLSAPLGEEQQFLVDQLLANVETRTIQGHIIGLAAVTVDHYIPEVSSVAHRLRDTLETAALFVLVGMPKGVQLVARSNDDVIDVGEVARLLGGGGHSRASAASIPNRSLSECAALIWEAALERVQPVTRVADLMSYGARTVDAGQRLREVSAPLRRIGHEGYPVLQEGRVAGLITRRDLDRALEHGLGEMRVGDVMTKGAVFVRPMDAVAVVERQMVESGWGQIPVVDEHERLIGIVTRTDLIKHWSRIHPDAGSREKTVTLTLIESVLGNPVARLAQALASLAQAQHIKLYLVGGVVRDLFLNRSNYDIDFVVEGDAIAFAESLREPLGGQVSSFKPFGTAKWKPDDETSKHLQVQLRQLPGHVDFASTRYEFYEHPTALPTVYTSSVKLDLQRRDFTINTLAVQLSPAASFGRVLDFYGGLRDLQEGVIRVLHSLSFIDDPTRIIRALRFQRRLGFRLDSRTEELMEIALPMLRRITGERVRNEIDLLLCEQQPEEGLLDLERRGILKAIHPAFEVNARIVELFQAARALLFPWPVAVGDFPALYWHLLVAGLEPERVESVCERLLVPQGMTQSMLVMRDLLKQRAWLAEPNLRPSQISARLKPVPELALLAVWMWIDEPLIRQRIRLYWAEWRLVKPATTGHHLRERGIPPGRCYGIVLSRLLAARLDGEVRTDDDEARLLEHLLTEERLCDGRP